MARKDTYRQMLGTKTVNNHKDIISLVYPDWPVDYKGPLRASKEMLWLGELLDIQEYTKQLGWQSVEIKAPQELWIGVNLDSPWQASEPFKAIEIEIRPDCKIVKLTHPGAAPACLSPVERLVGSCAYKVRTWVNLGFTTADLEQKILDLEVQVTDQIGDTIEAYLLIAGSAYSRKCYK